MITVEQFKKALATYIDQEIAAKIQGAGKWLVGIGAGAYISRIDQMVEKHLDTLVSLGFAKEDGMLDLEKAYKALKEQSDKHGAIVQQFPLIGSVTFSGDDIEKLYKIAKNQ